ncbi:GntR family transcriptional regulator [Streptomyces sp. Ru71]|uniref:GntR family transcriptional regulator n=1 Tax=Streptomyces sp. Ru71 TaxID=2080746 RepID=UPI000CDD09A6|nr:GntR family transcriptional regulator [Streptomyces sp. Ru71]POX47386.1 GntR family transcriptional regulator [Streptomyces sp. Ru71]
MSRTTPLDHPHTTPLDHPHTADCEEPLYRRVARRLLAELTDGSVPPGERLPSERHLAAHYGVSRETVRQALEVLRHRGLVATDRRGSHAALPGPALQASGSLTFPVGARGADRDGLHRATVAWQPPPPQHAEALGLAPNRPTLVHRYDSTAADGRGRRTAVTSFSAVALGEVEELARYRDRADGTASAQLRRVYDWMRRAGLTLHHRDVIVRADDGPTMRVTRYVQDQYARPLEITDLVVDTGQEALVYEFTLPAAG